MLCAARAYSTTSEHAQMLIAFLERNTYKQTNIDEIWCRISCFALRRSTISWWHIGNRAWMPKTGEEIDVQECTHSQQIVSAPRVLVLDPDNHNTYYTWFISSPNRLKWMCYKEAHFPCLHFTPEEFLPFTFVSKLSLLELCWLLLKWSIEVQNTWPTDDLLATNIQ